MILEIERGDELQNIKFHTKNRSKSHFPSFF